MIRLLFLILLPLQGISQVLVYEEAHHIPVIEVPQHFRMMYVWANPGDTTQMHQHTHDICYLVLDGTTLWLDSPDTEPRTVDLPDGYVGSQVGSTEIPYTHRFGVVGDSSLWIWAIENLKFETIPTPKLQGEFINGYTSDLSNERFEVGTLTLPPGSSYNLYFPKSSMIILKETGVLKISGPEGRNYSLIKKGDWQPITGVQRVFLSNSGPKHLSCWIIQIL